MIYDENDLLILERDLNRLPEALESAMPMIAGDYRQSWKIWILSVDAVDSRDYLQSVGDRRVSSREFIIDTASNANVTYSDIVERGRRDTPNYPVRTPAGKAIEALHNTDQIDRRVKQQLDRFLRH